MNKSIKLYKKKYGNKKNLDLNEYLKANAIIRENIGSENIGPVKMAINVLSNIVDRTNIYELKKGVLKYIISFHIEHKDYINALAESKQLYVSSRENYDIEESAYALEAILFNLAKLKQVEKIRELAKDKVVQKTVPSQLVMAYQIYAMLQLDLQREIIRSFESKVKGLKGEVFASILYNIAETYFRQAQYEKAIKYYDKFVSEYSAYTEASFARVRLGLCYELLGKPEDKTIALYLGALNKSTSAKASYEAKIRYVSLRSIRKNIITDEDREVRVFLDHDDVSRFGNEIKKLLWSVRLRSFIVDNKFEEGFSYLKAIPVASMKPLDVQVFTGDGAEIVYGLITKLYKDGNYTSVINVWNNNKNDYVDKVALDPFVNFIVCKSYVSLGLYDSFENTLKYFKSVEVSPRRTYPIWVDRESNDSVNMKSMFEELNVVKSLGKNEFKEVVTYLKKWKSSDRRSKSMKKYYYGVVNYRQKQFGVALKYFEEFLSSGNNAMLDQKSVAELLRGYTDSLYELNKMDKYMRVAEAMISDIEVYKKKTSYLNDVVEKITYNRIEILQTHSLEKKTENKIVNVMKNFISKYPKSQHLGRVKYILGTMYVSLKNEKMGKAIFKELLNNKTVPTHIKDLVRSELSLIEIRNKVL